MFGFININMRNMQRNNQVIIHNAVDKMTKGELEVSDILDSEELVADIKTGVVSPLSHFFMEKKNIKNLMNYVIREPLSDEHKIGHKFPYLACELLCSENPKILKGIFDENKEDEDEEDGKKKPKKKSDDDDEIDLDIDDNLAKNSEDIILANKEEDIITNDDKFKVSEEESNSKLERLMDKKEEDDMVNIDTTDDNPFEKKSNERYGDINDDLKIEDQDTNENKTGLIDMSKTQNSENLEGMIVEQEDKTEINEEKPDKIEKVEQSDDTVKNSDNIDNTKSINKINDSENEEIEENIQKEPSSNNDQKEEKKDSLNVSQDKFDSELLDYFFNFLSSNENLNFVLCGYFAKIFGHLLNHRQSLLMKYLLVSKPSTLKLFTRHINRKSIVECIYKILISYSEDIPNSLDLKINFLKDIIAEFNPDDDEVVTNVCDLILDMFTVRKMYLLFISNKSIFEMIFEFVLQNINNGSFKYLVKVLVKVNENILKDFGSAVVTPAFTCNETQELFFNFTYNVSNLISGNSSYNSQTENPDETQVNMQNLNNQFQLIFNTLACATEVILKDFVSQDNLDPVYMETTFGVSIRILGAKRLLEIEYIRSILEILINANANNIFNETLDLNVIINKIVESNFFTSAIVIFLISEQCFPL